MPKTSAQQTSATTSAVAIPADLCAALRSNEAALAAFEAMSLSHRREYVRWIDEAKQQSTRARRIVRTVQRLVDGKKTSAER